MPFTVEQFFEVFESYNLAIWPAQIAAYILGIAAVILAFRGDGIKERVAAGILALFWIWMGIFYHIVHFSRINPAARVFGFLFILQGLLFIITGTVRGRIRFRFSGGWISVTGFIFILFSMVIYPLIGKLAGHAYPGVPVFGVAPCPVTIFTFGLMLWVSRPVPVYNVLIPLIWSLIGTSAAFNLSVPQDYGLGIAGILGTVLLIVRNRRLKRQVADGLPEAERETPGQP
ncbi:MAG: DUF6064 family protein [Candidatus Krumholzibacteriales bacterium]